MIYTIIHYYTKEKKIYMSSFDLDRYVRENYEEIVKCKKECRMFPWEDDAVESVYKLINDTMGRMRIFRKYREDLVQDCALRFFEYIVYKFNPTFDTKISSFCSLAWKRQIQNILTQKSFVFNDKLIKLDNEPEIIIEDEYKLLKPYAIQDNSPCSTPGERYEADLYNNFLLDLALSEPLVYRYFYEGKTTQQIAEENKKFGISPQTHQGVSFKINKAMEKLKEIANNSEFAPEK